jgi:hypothetical protein
MAIRHIVAALHGMLRQRIQGIRPVNVGRSDVPGVHDVLRRATHQEVRVNADGALERGLRAHADRIENHKGTKSAGW